MAASEEYPEGLKYHREHDWARIEGDEATLGITWFAQDALGELVHFEAPEPGATVTKDAAYAEVESVKAVSDVIAPLSGEVTAVNDQLSDKPELVNSDPYGDGWLVIDESRNQVAHVDAPAPGEPVRRHHREVAGRQHRQLEPRARLGQVARRLRHLRRPRHRHPPPW